MIVSNPAGPFDATWDSLERYQTPRWYEDAKLGIFIHWGVYSVPAFGNEWYPRNMYLKDHEAFRHHVETFGPQDKFGYKDFIPLFKGERFDAAEWVELFEAAGARYIVPVAEHHDGFALYATPLSRWNAAEMGPKRDVIGELAKACAGSSLTFGLSSHRAEHWWYMNGGRTFDCDVQNPELADLYGPGAPEGTQPDEAFLEDWLRRSCELVDRFLPRVFYFDWWIEQPVFAPYLRRFAAYYYNRAYAAGVPAAINYKNEAFPEKAAVFDIERGQLGAIRSRTWQTCTAVGKKSWGFIEGEDRKDFRVILRDLVDVVSKNGNMLLNVGPRADGTIDEADRSVLLAIGEWLKVNGEAIYGTRPWNVYGEGPTEITAGGFHDSDQPPFTSEDFRFTSKPGTVYATIMGDASGEVLIHSLGSGIRLEPGEVTGAEVLGAGPVRWTRSADGLHVHLPNSIPGPAVIKVSFEQPGQPK